MDSEKSPPPILAVLAPSLFLSVPKYTDQKKLREELAHNSRLQSIIGVVIKEKYLRKLVTPFLQRKAEGNQCMDVHLFLCLHSDGLLYIYAV